MAPLRFWWATFGSSLRISTSFSHKGLNIHFPGFEESYDALIYHAQQKGDTQRVKSLVKRQRKGRDIAFNQVRTALRSVIRDKLGL